VRSGEQLLIPQPIAYLIGLTGLFYLVQGWVVGEEGFSQTLSIASVLASVLSLAWMIWLGVVAWRMQDANEGGSRSNTIPASSR
jgi:hypothetical protein